MGTPSSRKRITITLHLKSQTRRVELGAEIAVLTRRGDLENPFFLFSRTNNNNEMSVCIDHLCSLFSEITSLVTASFRTPLRPPSNRHFTSLFFKLSRCFNYFIQGIVPSKKLTFWKFSIFHPSLPSDCKLHESRGLVSLLYGSIPYELEMCPAHSKPSGISWMNKWASFPCQRLFFTGIFWLSGHVAELCAFGHNSLISLWPQHPCWLPWTLSPMLDVSAVF